MNKLEILLDKLEIKDRTHFQNASLEKIICNKKQNKYTFFIKIEKPLPIDLYLDFTKRLNKVYGKTSTISSHLTSNTFTLESLIKYYKYYLEEYSKNAPLLGTFIDNTLKLEKENLIITLANKAEEMKFSSIKSDLEKKLNKAGFSINIKTIIDETTSLEIRKEIEMSKTKEMPKMPKKRKSHNNGK